MNSTLFIKHLSSKLNSHERQDFLKHFGAEKVWFINENSHTAFAQFRSVSAAEEALHRLHQLEVLGKRLTVEYANDREQSKQQKSSEDSTEDGKWKQFLDSLNSWNPSLNLYQPPPPHLFYEYPSPTPMILLNIMDALLKNNCFYNQTLHLMNKMCLDSPFGDVNEDIKLYIKKALNYLDIPIPNQKDYPPQSMKIINSENNKLSSDESEISSDENVPTVDNSHIRPPLKRKSNVKIINKLPKLTLQMQISNAAKSKTTKLKTEDVFEDVRMQENKKIELKVSSTHLPTASSNSVIENVGEMGKLFPVKTSEQPMEVSDNQVDNTQTAAFITQKELLKNKVSQQDMKVLPIFKNYNPGAPSTKLYIKNLAKDVNTDDLERIYKRFLEDCDYSDKQLFDIRLMQEGRMKGQAFINFPNVELSEMALNETNGFILKNKPMVVQFARASK